MNKGQLIEAVAAELETSKAQASRAVDAVVQSITNGIKHDESVTIVSKDRVHKVPRKKILLMAAQETLYREFKKREDHLDVLSARSAAGC